MSDKCHLDTPPSEALDDRLNVPRVIAEGNCIEGILYIEFIQNEDLKFDRGQRSG